MSRLPQPIAETQLNPQRRQEALGVARNIADAVKSSGKVNQEDKYAEAFQSAMRWEKNLSIVLYVAREFTKDIRLGPFVLEAFARALLGHCGSDAGRFHLALQSLMLTHDETFAFFRYAGMDDRDVYACMVARGELEMAIKLAGERKEEHMLAGVLRPAKEVVIPEPGPHLEPERHLESILAPDETPDLPGAAANGGKEAYLGMLRAESLAHVLGVAVEKKQEREFSQALFEHVGSDPENFGSALGGVFQPGQVLRAYDYIGMFNFGADRILYGGSRMDNTLKRLVGLAQAEKLEAPLFLYLEKNFKSTEEAIGALALCTSEDYALEVAKAADNSRAKK